MPLSDRKQRVDSPPDRHKIAPPRVRVAPKPGAGGSPFTTHHLLLAAFLLQFVVFFAITGAIHGQSALSPDAIQKYTAQGQQALAAGRYEEAEQAFEQLRQLEPGVAEVHANLGAIYFQERKFEQAVPALRQALKLNPRLANSATLLAISLSEMGSFKEAVPGLEKGFHASSDPEVKRMCGLQLTRAYTDLQQPDKAVQVALELERQFPKDPEVLYHAGRLFGNYAYLTMEQLAQVAPGSDWRHQAAAEAFEAQGDYDLAVREYRTVVQLAPDRPGIHFRLGRTLIKRSQQSQSAEDAAEATREFEAELQLDPTNANAAYELADADRDAGEFDDAVKYFEQALKYYPDFEDAHLGLAAALISQQKMQEALPHLQKAIALNPANEISWYRLSQVQGAMGKSDGQKQSFAEFQKLRAQKSAEAEAARELFSASEITKQKLDKSAPEQ